MKNKMFFKVFGVLLVAIAVVFFLVPVPAFSAEFSADLVITAPDSNYTFKLYVKDTMYRLEKVKGGMKCPPFPTIVNRNTGLTWGLNPQVRQYVEETDPVKTMMMNPLVAWEFMRKDMKATPAGEEMVEGYSCQLVEYRVPGESRVSSRVMGLTQS